MTRPASVTVVAVFTILGSLFTLLMAAVVGLVMHMPLPAGVQQTSFNRYAMLFTAGLFSALGVWGIVTAIGLFRMKPWARISTLIFSGGLVFYAACSLFFALLLPVFAPADLPESFVRGMMIGMAVFYGALLAIGIWWLVLFNRPAIKAQFYGGTMPVEPFPLPLSITTIAWLLLTTCIFFPLLMFTDWPATFLAWIATGWLAKALYLVYGVAGVAAGYGLLKRKTWAYWLTVGYFGFGLLSLLVFYGLPGAQGRTEELSRMVIPKGMNVDVPQVTPWEGVLMGLVGVGLPLYFLLTRKKRYDDAGRAASPVSTARPQG